MPSESLMLAVTSGLGVGIFAGIVSGVCYIVVTGFASKRPRTSNSTRWHCTICGLHFPSIENLLETGRVVTCIKCGTGICRARCSKLIKDTENQKIGWVCQTCQHPDSWFKGILRRTIQPSSEGGDKKVAGDPDAIDEMDEDLDRVKKKDEQHVKGFIERLVEAMLGNNIDNACVSRMYNDQKYLPVLGQSPCSAHASLRLLIQRIIQEAIGLPPLEKNDTEIEMSNGEVTNNSYEDLLATAILNKVVENYQDELGTSKPNSVSSRMSSSSVCQNEKEYYFGTETLCSKWQNGINAAADIDAASVSSSEDWIRSDSSVGSTKYVDSMSLRIQQRIDEESSTDEEPKVKPVLNQTLAEAENEWQENWVMQKRPFGRNSSPVPVPMLVPNPSSEAKVLIGDKEVDDTSDLSDTCSDFDEVASSHSIENILVNSKTVIGGKNVLSCNEIPNNLDFDLSTQHQQDQKHLDVIKEGIPFASFESQTEQDTEYTEKYATLPRTITILRSSTPNSENSMEILPKSCILTNNAHDETDGNCIEIKGVNNHNGYHNNENEVELDDTDTKEIFKGSYSEREKEKWNNAIEMKNNPYSSENLKQRLSNQSTNSVSSLFSSKNSTSSSTSIKPKASSSEKPVPDNDVQGSRMYTAIPVFIQLDDLSQTDAATYSDVKSSISPSTIDISSDSDLSVERIYNLHSGNVYINGKSNELLNNSDADSNTTVENSPRESIEKSMDFSSEFSTTDESLHNQTTKGSDTSTNSEITDLCDKHLVKDLLGQFSKSYPNLSSQGKDDDCEDIKSNVPPSTPKRDTSKLVYSLTARSIPREFRDELRKREPRRSSASAAILHEVPQETPQFPIAKSKIKFFESLK